MRTTHLLWTGTAAVGPRQEVLTQPRQERAAGSDGRRRRREAAGRGDDTDYQARPTAPHRRSGPAPRPSVADRRTRPAELSVPVTTLGPCSSVPTCARTTRS